MTNTNLKILKSLLLLNGGVLVFLFIFFSKDVLFSFQIGFISTTLVMFGSMVSYRRMINFRISHHRVSQEDDKDIIDRLEDPYDLYSEDIIHEEPIDKKVDFVQTVKDEKKRQKENRRSFTQTLKDTRAALSFYRVSAYVLLVLGFFYLDRHDLLHIPSYIIALGLPFVVLIWVLLDQNNDTNHLTK